MPDIFVQDEIDKIVGEWKAKHPHSKLVARVVKAEKDNDKTLLGGGKGLYAGYKPNRISVYLLMLQTGRLGELEKILFRDMEEFKEDTS